MDLATWRNLAIILLAIEGMILVAVPAVIFYFLVKGMSAGSRWLRQTGFPQAQYYTRLAADQTKTYSAKITAPIERAEVASAQVKGTVSSVPQALKRRKQRSQHG